jgi:hypothetical protein
MFGILSAYCAVYTVACIGMGDVALRPWQSVSDLTLGSHTSHVTMSHTNYTLTPPLSQQLQTPPGAKVETRHPHLSLSIRFSLPS